MSSDCITNDPLERENVETLLKLLDEGFPVNQNSIRRIVKYLRDQVKSMESKNVRLGDYVEGSRFYLTPELGFFHRSYEPGYATLEEAVKCCNTLLNKSLNLMVVRRDIRTTRVA